MMKRNAALGLVIVAISLGRSSQAHDYTAGTMGQVIVGSPTPLSFTDSQFFDNGPAGSGIRAGVAAAGPGLANAVANVFMTTDEDYTYSGGIASTFVESDGRFTLQHIRLTGPVGTPPGTVVGYSINFTLTSEFAASHSGPGELVSGASGVITWNTDSSLGSAGGELGHRTVSGNGTSEATGIFSSTGATTSWMARAGDEINVNFNLHTNANVGDFRAYNGPGGAQMQAKASMQLTLAGVGVFTFSEPGWTADTNDGIITDNRFSLPDPPGGDFTGDDVADAADYVLWRKTLGTLVDRYTAADGNGNGYIEQGDYDVWRSHYGDTTGVGSMATQPVPEPSALATAAIGLVGSVLSGRRWSARLLRRGK